jgi:probable poly-beta-1,6-N-acetyl-D-glucosamine export protein
MMKNDRDLAIEAIRISAILAVILIHTTTKSLEAVNLHVDRLPWPLILNQLARFAVPIFFLVSGLVLELSTKKNEDWVGYFVKRFKKIVIPYFLWSTVYYFFIYTNHNNGFIVSLFYGNAAYQLYFIPSLLILYAIFPLVHKWITHPLILGILGAVELVLLRDNYNVKYFNLPYPVVVALMNYWIFFLGIALAKYKTRVKERLLRYRILISIGALLSGIYVCYQGYTRYLATYNFQMFYSSWRPSVLIYTLFVFGSLYYLFSIINIKHKLLGLLSGLSFPVFFIHVLVIEESWKYFKLLPYKQIWFDPMYFAIVTGVSFGLSYLMYNGFAIIKNYVKGI